MFRDGDSLQSLAFAQAAPKHPAGGDAKTVGAYRPLFDFEVQLDKIDSRLDREVHAFAVA